MLLKYSFQAYLHASLKFFKMWIKHLQSCVHPEIKEEKKSIAICV